LNSKPSCSLSSVLMAVPLFISNNSSPSITPPAPSGQAIFCSPTPPQDQVPLLGGSGILLDRPKPLECTPGPPESTTDSGLLFKTGLKTFLF
jgi:hypothetical protein